jgi:hypothetical protein
MSVSPRPTGSDEEAMFHGETYDLTRGPGSQLRNSSTVKIRKGPKGFFLQAAPPSSGGVSKLQLYKITTLFKKDYIGAKLWNPNTDNGDGTFGAVSGSEIKIAKCIGARMPLSEIIDGVFVTYVYDSGAGDNLRKASSVGYTDEWHVMHTRYLTDGFSEGVAVPPGLIFVSKSKNGTGVKDAGGNQINLIEVQPQRFWTFQSNQSGVL